MAWSWIGQGLAVVGITAMLCVTTRSAEAQCRKGSCMASWLTLSRISRKSVPAYERSLKLVRIDQGNYRTPLLIRLIPALFDGDSKDAKKFLHCLGKQDPKCKSRPPCGKGGVCLLSKKNKYYCKCRPGFSGRCCHLPDDKCRSSPCQNNGTCVNGEKTFTCRCPVQFEGKICETRWLSRELFENIKNKQNGILSKVAEGNAQNAKMMDKITRNLAQSRQNQASLAGIARKVTKGQAAISTVLRKTANLERQLSSISLRVNTISKNTALMVGRYSSPGLSCLDVKKSGGNRGDGFYWIKPSRYHGPAYRAYCDMTTEGGGWTLFATKVSYNFVFPATKFNPSSAMSTRSNAKGCILPGTSWFEVLFRFGPTPSPVRTIYSRYGGRGTAAAKRRFGKFLECKELSDHEPISGFVKYSPYSNGGRRTPRTGYYRHPDLWYFIDYGISGDRSRPYKFVHLWTDTRGTNYDKCDHHNACGSKCVAGVCYLNRPVWLMYR